VSPEEPFTISTIRCIGASSACRTGPGNTPRATTSTTSGATASHSLRDMSLSDGQKRRIQPEGTVKKTRWNIHSM